MNKEERLKELNRILTTPENQLIPREFKDFNKLWKCIDELVGRSTMTHELAFPDLLYEEIRSGKHGNPFGEALVRAANLTKKKKAIIIAPSEVEGIPLGFKVVGKVDLSLIKRGRKKK